MKTRKIIRLDESSLRSIIRNIIRESPQEIAGHGMNKIAQEIKNNANDVPEDLMWDFHNLSSNDYSRMALNWLKFYVNDNKVADNHVREWIRSNRKSNSRTSLSDSELEQVNSFLKL